MKKTVFCLIAIVSVVSLKAQNNLQSCITINGIPNPPSKSITICPGNFQLSATNCHPSPLPTSDDRYRWRNVGAGTNSPDLLSGDISYNAPGTYALKLFNLGGTLPSDTVYDTITVNFHPSPPALDITNGSGAILCRSGYPLTLNTSTSGTLTNYKWFRSDNPTNILGTNTSLVVRYPNNSGGNYEVTAQDVNGCLTGDVIALVETEAPHLSLGPDQTRCVTAVLPNTLINILQSNNSLPFNNPSTLKYSWKNLNTNTIIPNPPVTKHDINVSPTITTDYEAIVENILGCKAADTIRVTVYQVPSVNAGNDTSICYGGNAYLRATASGGLPPYSYSWSPGSISGQNQTVSPTSTTAYMVTLTESSGCGFPSATDSKVVTVNPDLSLTISGNTTICYTPYNTTTLTANAPGGTGAKNYVWSPAAGLSATNVAMVTANPPATTTYKVLATDAVGCKDSVDVTVTRYLPPISLQDRYSIIEGESALEIDARQAQTTLHNFVWKNLDTDETVWTSGLVNVVYEREDTITVEVKVTDPGSGCYNTDTTTIYYIGKNETVFVPNIFSISATLEANKRLKVFGDNLASEGFMFKIYNKWGQLMWETNDLNEAKAGWDGGPQIEGVYTYMMEGKFKHGVEIPKEKKTGNFTLIK